MVSLFIFNKVYIDIFDFFAIDDDEYQFDFERQVDDDKCVRYSHLYGQAYESCRCYCCFHGHYIKGDDESLISLYP